MIAGNKRDLLPLPGAPEYFLDYGVLCWRPIDAATHRPKIDDVTDQKEVLRVVISNEFQQSLSLTPSCSQMHVGDEDRTDAVCREPLLQSSFGHAAAFMKCRA